MEEKDVQIKGYKIRLPLDVIIVASASVRGGARKGSETGTSGSV